MSIPLTPAAPEAGGPLDGPEPAEPAGLASTLDRPVTEELLNELARALAERLNRLLDVLDS